MQDKEGKMLSLSIQVECTSAGTTTARLDKEQQRRNTRRKRRERKAKQGRKKNKEEKGVTPNTILRKTKRPM
jgi:hypothetical protein